jgi:V/A-type H+-transporting ATPase subunit I
VSLKELEIETDRILRSVYFEEVKLPDQYLDTPDKMIEKIEDRLLFVNQEIEGLQLRALAYDEQYGERIRMCYAHLMLELKIEQLKKLLAVTNNYVYISGWVSKSDAIELEDLFSKYEERLLTSYSHADEVSERLVPPTKLKNNWLFKPFETLIHMYGTPSYKELDPTAFVGLAYMVLFGAMFGDVGQGLLLAFVGYMMTRKSSSDYGAILLRIGLISSVFGFFYDSFFGYEHFLSSFFPEKMEFIFLRPIENINQILVLAVVSGIGFLYISYIYSVINKLKNKDIKEGIFGRNGIAGILLFTSILVLVGGSFLNIQVPETLLKVLIAVSIILMIIREPLANLIMKHKPLYHETVTEYYVESGFELLETFLGMLSNSVSFIRVGAFALNHVGLFMAFHTIALLIGTAMGEVAMFIVGNALVIALEGLIVLIQGLRLVYYEMFSKYYTGDGLAFVPTQVENFGGK